MDDETSRFDPQDIQATKGLAILSYLGILFLVPMLVNKDSQFTKFHVNQGIALLIIDIIGSIVCGISNFIPFIGWIISSAVGVGIFVLMIMGIINAAQGQAKRLPIIGNIEIYK